MNLSQTPGILETREWVEWVLKQVWHVQDMLEGNLIGMWHIRIISTVRIGVTCPAASPGEEMIAGQPEQFWPSREASPAPAHGKKETRPLQKPMSIHVPSKRLSDLMALSNKNVVYPSFHNFFQNLTRRIEKNLGSWSPSQLLNRLAVQLF